MPQRDTYHAIVRRALERDGWIITHDPLVLAFGDTNLFVDLAAEGPLAAEREGRKIAVEIKSFVGSSAITELERALGQFSLYRFLLSRTEPDRILYLAVSADTYASVFRTGDARDLMAAEHVHCIVFEAFEEVIVQWIE